eukprot:746522-Hanusia_phi.AAC.10
MATTGLQCERPILLPPTAAKKTQRRMSVARRIFRSIRPRGVDRMVKQRSPCQAWEAMKEQVVERQDVLPVEDEVILNALD